MKPDAGETGATRVSAALVDRDDVLGHAARRWAESRDGVGQFLLVAGEAGIGKTRILDEVLALLDGAPVLTTRAWPRDAEFPGAVLYDLARELRQHGMGAASATITERLDRRDTAGDEARRHRLLIADLAEAVLALLADHPVLLRIEDLHWADELSLAVLERLAPLIRRTSSMVIATYRSDELMSGSALSRWRVGLLQQRFAEEVSLPRLDRSGTRRLTEALLGTVPAAELVDSIHERSNGIPLHIEELVAAAPLPARDNDPYLIRHGAGYSIFQHSSNSLEQTVRVFVAPHAPVKIIQVNLKNTSTRIRRVNTVFFAEWVLGTTHDNSAPYIVPEFAANQFALLARNPYNMDFHERVAFLACTREPTGITADRAEFLGSHGSFARPAMLERVGMTPRIDAGVDPCAAMHVLLWLRPGETKEVTFLLGEGKDRADAENIISQFQDIQCVESAWEELGTFWNGLLDQIQVDTPNKAMDLLLNRWLLYQSLSSRFWGRTGFYQSSGAYGFRDQLQDSMAYVHTNPKVVREHILESARYQFEEGDVLHWWHPPGGRGLRTRCSDDLLWLPFVTAHYVEATGDQQILNETIPFLRAEPLKPEEHERYGQFPNGTEGTLYEHCCRAITKGTTSGAHGIPLMGAHDWNDGMNLVGAKGKGESIWLGWFLGSTLTDFAHICEVRQDTARAEDYRNKAKKIFGAIESAAWDGDWYRRAYYDDGSPLGSKENMECQIDAIAQSWSVISKGGDSSRTKTAMESVFERLVDQQDELIELLTPPFDKTPRSPGYIKGYPPGIRENGGQYTHAALWTIWAFAELGQADRAHKLFELINPINHSDVPEKANRYRVEPYVVVADVYSTQPHNGRGGWTWYTGSASWMYRLGVERLLGINRFDDHLEIHPCIPSDWKGYQINYRFGTSMFHIRIENPHGETREVADIEIDGKKNSTGKIPLSDDGKVHEVVVRMKS